MPKSPAKTGGVGEAGDRGASDVVPSILPEVRFTSREATTPAAAGKKSKKGSVPRLQLNEQAMSGTESGLDPAAAVKTPRKAKKVAKDGSAELEAGAAAVESGAGAPADGSARKGARKGRMVPSRYMESAKSRAAAVPAKNVSDASCLSINQSRLFSTATASTPNSTLQGGKVQDASSGTTQRKPPPKMAALPVADKLDKEKAGQKIRKAQKTATVKVKPVRAGDPALKGSSGGGDRLSEHEVLYNQYLQWQYMLRMSQAAREKELGDMELQSRQLSQLVENERKHVLDLERKVQAVTVYRETASLERQVSEVLTTVNGSADAVRGDLSRLTTSLESTRNRLKLKSFTEPTDVDAFHEALTAAAERCRDRCAALQEITAPHANLLQHTAEAVTQLNTALQDTAQHTQQCNAVVQDLSSLALREASLSIGSSVQ